MTTYPVDATLLVSSIPKTLSMTYRAQGEKCLHLQTPLCPLFSLCHVLSTQAASRFANMENSTSLTTFTCGYLRPNSPLPPPTLSATLLP